MQETYFLNYMKLQELITLLRADHFQTIGPQVRDGVIVYDELDAIEQLPWGVRDHQNQGYYQLKQHDKTKAFSWANGPAAVKPELFKPKETLWQVSRNEQGQLTFVPVEAHSKLALLGIRPCDLHALKIQDLVFIESDFQDQRYQSRRQSLFLVVVNCSYSSNNCFCLTAGGHPQADSGYDIALTEIEAGFVATFASQSARSLLSQLDLSPTSLEQKEVANRNIQQAIQGQTKRLPEGDLPQLLANSLEHPRWHQVASRCLSCGNCTQVCPTCFCHREKDEPALDEQHSDHVREWDSCFTEDHSYIHGMVVRKTTLPRYRQWLTHKLGTWHQQFGTSGCVGCGRCISWCPVGIDLTEEIAALGEETPHAV